MPHVVNKINFNSNYSYSELCEIGKEFKTDKSPFVEMDFCPGGVNWRHSYTPFYSLIFSQLKYKKINFGEIGILNNASMCMWRKYFHNATIYGWDANVDAIARAKEHLLPDVHYDFMDASSVETIDEVMSKYDFMFDVLIDDASHEISHQTAVINTAFKYLNPGGILIIEDLDRIGGHSDDTYIKEFFSAGSIKYYDSVTVVETDHCGRYSFTGNYDNEKLMYLVRNTVPYTP